MLTYGTGADTASYYWHGIKEYYGEKDAECIKVRAKYIKVKSAVDIDKSRKFVIGQSFDITLATQAGGYNIEGGWLIGDNGKKGAQFISHGLAYGVEASVGYNMIFIIPKKNFKFEDLKGLGAGYSFSIGLISVSFFGNSSPKYPENSIYDSYIGMKIGIGTSLSFINVSVTPNSETLFHNWIPESLLKIDWLNLHWH